MLGVQEQTRPDRVDANGQDPAHPCACVPTMVVEGQSFRRREAELTQQRRTRQSPRRTSTTRRAARRR